MTQMYANEQIRSARVVLIDENGTNHGEILRTLALAQAMAAGLDLVQVGDSKGVPVCKLADYGKLKFEQSKKAKEAARSAARVPTTKEIYFHLNTSEHDLDVKKRKIREMLADRHRVKVLVELRKKKRENITRHGQSAKELLAKFVADFEGISKAEEIRSSERSVYTTLSPSN